MTEKAITISIPEGLTAKSATALIAKANDFPCSIFLESNARRVNCKSLLGVVSLGLKCGDSVVLSASGADETAAAEALAAML